jgi:hypothetical protein
VRSWCESGYRHHTRCLLMQTGRLQAMNRTLAAVKIARARIGL